MIFSLNNISYSLDNMEYILPVICFKDSEAISLSLTSIVTSCFSTLSSQLLKNVQSESVVTMPYTTWFLSTSQATSHPINICASPLSMSSFLAPTMHMRLSPRSTTNSKWPVALTLIPIRSSSNDSLTHLLRQIGCTQQSGSA